jgi:hypothetical protein
VGLGTSSSAIRPRPLKTTAVMVVMGRLRQTKKHEADRSKMRPIGDRAHACSGKSARGAVWGLWGLGD